MKSVGGGSGSETAKQYANYKAVAVSQGGHHSNGHLKMYHRKGNSADPQTNDHHSSKKQQFKISGLWNLGNHRGDNSETGGSNQGGH